MKFHPFSEIFPLIEGAEFDALVEDIKAHGLREKIWTYESKILDGRNRFLACKKAGVSPEFRKYSGKDPLAFVVSLNVQRRHLTVQQLAFAGARIATLRKGDNQHTARAVSSQKEVAEQLGVSSDSIQRARKVIEHGSKALQEAVESGEVPLKKAAAVVDLPKSEQLNAATQKPEPEDDAPERPDDADEDAALAAAEADYSRRVDAVMQSDDKLAEARAQLKQQAALVGTLEITRDSYMRGKDAVTKMLQTEQRKVAKLEKENAKLRDQIEGMRERIAIMEAA